jgi:hypothetical protein
MFHFIQWLMDIWVVSKFGATMSDTATDSCVKVSVDTYTVNSLKHYLEVELLAIR